MSIRRRRVYFDYSYSRKMRIEGWLSLSIYLAAGIFFLSLLVCLPHLISLVVSWLLPDRMSYQLGLSRAEQTSFLATLCQILMPVSGAYLFLALFISSHAKQRQH